MANSEVERTERRWRENRQGFAFANYADALRKTGEAERALEVLREGLALHPTYLPANIVLGRCYLDIGDDESAHTAFQRVLSLDPENVIALKALADTSERQAHFAEAQRWLEQLLAVDRGNDAAREQLARVQVAALEAASAPVHAGVAATGEATDAAEPAPDAPSAGVASDAVALEHAQVEGAGAADATERRDPPALDAAAASVVIEETRHGWVSGPENAVEPTPLALDRFTDPVAPEAGAPAPEAAPDATLMIETVSAEPMPVEAHAGVETLVELTDEIELRARTADEYKIPDASEGFRDGITTSTMPDLEIERSHHDPGDDLGIAASAPTLLSPDEAAPSSLPGDVPSIAHETVDGSTAMLAASLHGASDFVADFEATHTDAPPRVDGGSLVGFVGTHEAAEPAPGAERAGVPSRRAVAAEPVAEAPPVPPAPPTPIPNPVLAAAMSGEEVLETWRRAAQARAEDIERRAAEVPPAPEPEAIVAAAHPVPAPADEPPRGAQSFEAEPAPPEHGEPVAALAEDEPDEPVFVMTEAMATLYETQGHHHDALRVYRELAVRSPHEPRFAEKVGQLESVLAAPPAPPAVAAAAPGGESVAAFFGRLLQGAPSALARNGHAPSPAGGLPTRPAEDPISLGSVFGEDSGSLARSPRPARAAAPSIDEFYGAGANGGDPRQDEDLEQFHAWLQGLKS